MNGKPGVPPGRAPIYPGMYADGHGMSLVASSIRDAWVFGLLPEGEACVGWNLGQMQGLLDKVDAAWSPYSHLPSLLPEALRERHQRIHDEAVARARSAGWDADLGDED